jgi:hypothetical protein
LILSFLRTACLACLISLLFINPVSAGEPDFLAPPPVDYQRVVRIKVIDPFGRPLKGVKADVRVLTGRLITGPVMDSSDKGFISFTVKPVVEDLNKDKNIRDRFLLYHTKLTYRLTLGDRIPVTGEIDDRQEFATFINPLYHGLDRNPDPDPIQRDHVLADYRDYLADPKDDRKLKVFIEALVSEGRVQRFKLRTRSIARDRKGRMSLRLDFLALFDPAKYGLTEAGRELVKGPVRSAVKAAEQYVGSTGYDIRATVLFQSQQRPFALPIEQTYVFHIAPDAIPELTAGHIPKHGITATVENAPLDLWAQAPQMAQ